MSSYVGRDVVVTSLFWKWLGRLVYGYMLLFSFGVVVLIAVVMQRSIVCDVVVSNDLFFYRLEEELSRMGACFINEVEIRKFVVYQVCWMRCGCKWLCLLCLYFGRARVGRVWC